MGSAKYLYEKDLQGDITGLIDESGNLVVRYTYDAWGKVTAADAAGTTASARAMANNHLLYRGYYYDSETGLYYLNSRYYDPEVGRFINADDYVSTGQGILGCNTFAYCNNNPVVRYDPNGSLSWLIGGIVGAIMGGVSSAINDSIMGREVTVGSVIKSAAVGFVSGAVSTIMPTDIFAAGLSAGITFVDSRLSGKGWTESLIAAGTAGIATYVSSKLCKRVLGSELTERERDAGKGVVTFFTSLKAELLGSVGRGVYASSRSNGSAGSSPGTPSSSYNQVRHGGRHWACKAMAW